MDLIVIDGNDKKCRVEGRLHKRKRIIPSSPFFSVVIFSFAIKLFPLQIMIVMIAWVYIQAEGQADVNDKMRGTVIR